MTTPDPSRGQRSGDSSRQGSSRSNGSRSSGSRSTGPRSGGARSSSSRTEPRDARRSSRPQEARKKDSRRGSSAAVRPRPVRDDTPAIPDEITGEELDRSALAELRTLPEGMRENVARLLVATEANLDDDPQLALRFAQAAKKKAARVAMVREAVGLAAYAAGDYTLALSELRAVRRMSGSDEHLATMADCERALGRPRKALELLASVPEGQLSPGATIEARLVGAGARRDLGQPEAAAVLLDIGALTSDSVDESIGRLRYAYADLLIELGRLDEARTWFTRAAETEAVLDAEERLAELQAMQA